MNEPDVHHLLLYDYVDDMLERRVPHREAHLARIASEREAGRIMLAGALGDPPTGAAIVFKGVSADDVQAFAVDDPYMHAGLIVDHQIAVWKMV